MELLLSLSPKELLLLIMKSKYILCLQHPTFPMCFAHSSCVRVVSSERPGMGKSLFIKRLAEKLGVISSTSAEAVKAVIPIHGPVVTSDVMLTFLKEHYKDDKCKIYHFDLASSVSTED